MDKKDLLAMKEKRGEEDQRKEDIHDLSGSDDCTESGIHRW